MQTYIILSFCYFYFLSLCVERLIHGKPIIDLFYSNTMQTVNKRKSFVLIKNVTDLITIGIITKYIIFMF